jgi:DNA polymerase III epsilon subunit-like protein
MIQYYAIDTETTGLDPKVHEITQISIIRCSDRHQLDKYIRAEYPDKVSPQALKVTGRTYADLLKGEKKEDVVDFCEKFLFEDGLTSEHRCFIAHNARFDRDFCHALWAKLDRKFPGDLWLDTKEFTRSLAIKKGIVKPKLNLQASLEIAQVKARPGAHNAVVDTQNAYLLWKKLMSEDIDHLPHIKRTPHILT